MRTNRLYVIAAIMAFLAAPLVFRSWGGSIVWLPAPGMLLYTITPALEIFVFVVIASKLMSCHRRIAQLLRVIAVLTAIRAFFFLLTAVSGDTDPFDIFFFAFAILNAYILISFVTAYAVLLSYLRKCNDPALKLLSLHCVLRICGWALQLPIARFARVSDLPLTISMHFMALFHLAAQIALGIMLLRYARQAHTPEDGNQDEDLELPLTNQA